MSFARKYVSCSALVFVLSCAIFQAQTAPQVELKIQLGHAQGKFVDAVAISPDGRWALTGAEDLTVRLWDIASGREIRRWDGYQGFMSHVGFSPDGREIITSDDHSTRVNDLATGREIRHLDPHGTNDVAFSSDSRFEAGSDLEGLRVWDTTTGEVVRNLGDTKTASPPIAISSDGRRLAIGEGKIVTLRDTASGKTIRRFAGHKADLDFVALSPDGKYLASRDNGMIAGVLSGESLRLWETVSAREIHNFRANSVLGQFTPIFSADSRQLLLLSGSSMELWDLGTMRKVRTYEGGVFGFSSATFSPDGGRLMAGCQEGEAIIWDALTGAELQHFRGLATDVTFAAISPDSSYFATSTHTAGEGVRVWDLKAGTEFRRFESDTAGRINPHGKEIVFSSDARFIAVGSLPVSLLDLRSGSTLREFGCDKDQCAVWTEGPIAVSKDDSSILAAETADSGEHIRLWNSIDGREVRTLEGYTGQVADVAVSPDGQLALTSDLFSDIARLWDIRTGREIQEFKADVRLEVEAVAFSPDSRTFLTAGGTSGVVQLWSTDERREIRRFDHGSAVVVLAAAFSNDGRWIVTGGSDGVIRIWDAATGAEIRQILANGKAYADIGAFEVRSVSFTSDGRFILTGLSDGTTRFWYLEGNEKLVMPGMVNILLSHNPNTFDRAAQLGIDLTLAGHAHGGQLSLHRGLSLVRLETRYVSGWYEKPGGQMYVNRGIGTTGPPIRVGARPEITVIELVRGA